MVSDAYCDLECLQDSNIHEFCGPVKIVFLDPPPNVYKKLSASFIGISTMMVGASFIIVFLFNMSRVVPLTNNLHVFFCTFGSQVAMSSAILMLNPLFGPATLLKKSRRRCQHIYLHGIGASCYMFGTIMSFINRRQKYTLHSVWGIISVCILWMALAMGPVIYYRKKNLIDPYPVTVLHRAFGVATFTSTTICFITGISTAPFSFWAGQQFDIIVIISLFCLVYTAVILITPVLHMHWSIW